MFKKHSFFLACLLLLALKFTDGQNRYKKYVFSQAKMGSPFTITLYGKDSIQAAKVAATSFKKVDSLNEIFSDYIDSSELNRLSRLSGTGQFVPVSSELFHLLFLSKKASQLSNGAFDITVGPVVKLWRKAREENIFPLRKQIRTALKKTGYQFMYFNDAETSVKLVKPGMQLDLGGIAKGYIAQVILDFIKQNGFPITMINAGGDIALGEAPPDHERGWKIGIALPEEKYKYSQTLLFIKNKAVATSGDIYQHFEWKGKKYSHIINPKTGMGSTALRNVTVIANLGSTADWLASACSVLPLKKAFQLVKKFPEAALYIAEKRGNKIYKKGNKNFYQLTQ